MTLIDEYARNRERRSIEKIIKNQLKSGLSAEVIAESADIPLSRVRDIERSLESESFS